MSFWCGHGWQSLLWRPVLQWRQSFLCQVQWGCGNKCLVKSRYINKPSSCTFSLGILCKLLPLPIRQLLGEVERSGKRNRNKLSIFFSMSANSECNSPGPNLQRQSRLRWSRASLQGWSSDNSSAHLWVKNPKTFWAICGWESAPSCTVSVGFCCHTLSPWVCLLSLHSSLSNSNS